MKPLLLPLLISIMFLSIQLSATAVVVPSVEPAKKTAVTGYKSIANMKLKEFQRLVGHKLTFKEKIAFLVLKHKMKRQAKAADADGELSFGLGLAGLGLFVLGLFVPYVIIASFVLAILAIVTGGMATRKDSDNRKAKAGKLLGWLTLGAIALLLILAAIIISNWN